MIPTTDITANGTPGGWRSVPFWSLFRRGKNTGFPEEELLSVYRDHGVIPKSSRDDNHNKESEDLSGYQLVTEGALVTNKMKAWQGSIAISRYRGIVSPAYYVYTPQSDEHDQFLHYLLRSEPYIGLYGRISKGVRVNQWDLEHEALRTVPVLLPDLATQRQIADFLDRETARIDLLIEKKQRLVALLGEKLQSDLEIALFVEGTKVVPLRRTLIAIEQGWSPDCETRQKEQDEWGVLKVGCVNGWLFRSLEHKTLPKNLAPRPELEVREGDLLVSRANSPELVGSAAIVSNAATRLLLCDKLYRLRLDTRLVSPEFALLTLRSKAARIHYSSRSNGASASMQNISQETVRTLPIPLPSLTRQAEVVEKFEKQKTMLSKTIKAVNGSIVRLKEYRSALITAAVTGQIDVQTYANSGTPDRRLDAIQEEMGA